MRTMSHPWFYCLCLAVVAMLTISCDQASKSTESNPPAIVTQPQGQFLYEGDPVTLAVTATGTEPMLYQWQKNGEDIPGATGTQYSLGAAVLTDAASYRCVVQNGFGSANSGDAQLQVVSLFYAPSPARISVIPSRASNFATEVFAVANSQDGTIGFYNNEGRITYQWLSQKTPRGMAINPNGEILVGNRADHRIDVYTPTGQFIRSFGDIGDPIAIHVAGGFIFAADPVNKVVKVYTASGESLVREIGSGKLSFPAGVCLLPSTNEVLVSDTYKQAFYVFDISGSYKTKISKSHDNPSGTPAMGCPQGITVDSAGNIYVVDSVWAGVFVFNSAKVYQKVIGQLGEGKGFLRTPLDVTILADGRVAVANLFNARIEVFNRGEAEFTSFTLVPEVALPESASQRILASSSRAFHDAAGSVQCNNCHKHSQMFGDAMLTSTNVAAVCSGCHNGITVPGAIPRIHKGTGFNVTCNRCHEPHRGDITNGNASLIRGSDFRTTLVKDDTTFLHKEANFTLIPLTFTGTGQFDFVKKTPGAGGTGTGICEICHATTAKYHRKDGNDDLSDPGRHFTKIWNGSMPYPPQNARNICVTCHRHSLVDASSNPTGFGKGNAGAIRCIDCHATQQGSTPRRAITGATTNEFLPFVAGVGVYTNNKGGHPWVAPTSATDQAPDRRCLVCHNMSKHSQGTVVVKNPDLADGAVGQLVEFARFNTFGDLVRGPRATPGTQDYLMDNHCLKCHDANGAAHQDTYKITNPAAINGLNPFNKAILAAEKPFEIDANVTHVDANSFYHPVKQYPPKTPTDLSNKYADSDTLEIVNTNADNYKNHNYPAMKTADVTINCWDCHAQLSPTPTGPAYTMPTNSIYYMSAHGANSLLMAGKYSNADMLLIETYADGNAHGTYANYYPGANTVVGTAQRNFCVWCHKYSVYYGEPTAYTGFKTGGARGHVSSNAHYGDVNYGGCRQCHAGLEKKTALAWDNNSGKGKIHGARFQWPAASPNTPNVWTNYFLMGGYTTGWKVVTGTKTCYYSACSHSGGKGYGPNTNNP